MYSIVDIHRNRIVDISYDDMGKKTMETVDFEPIVGLPTTDGDTGWRTYDGRDLRERRFDGIGAFKDFVWRNQDSMEIYGNISPIYQYIAQRYDGMDYDLGRIKTAFIDIEVHCDEGFPDPEIAAWPISSVSVKDNKTKKFYVAATKPYNKVRTRLDMDPSKINFRHLKDDSEILMWLIKVLRFIRPDVLCGWYSDNFDFPYIINRFDFVFEDESVKHQLSPVGEVYTRKVSDRDFRNVVRGITLYDYMRLYKKFIFTPRESYSLDFVANAELGETKIDYSEFDNLWELWEKDPQKYVDYNIYDVELIDRMNEKLGLIDLGFTLAYEARVNPVDIMGTTRIWDVYFYNYLRKEGIMVPPHKRHQGESYAGAYVKTPVTKIYDWVISYDLNSLYPHLQQQFNISPDCLVRDERENVGLDEISPRLLNREIEPDPRYVLAGNGCYFRKDKEGFIPKILRKIYDERTVFKKKMLSRKQELVELKVEMKRRGLS